MSYLSTLTGDDGGSQPITGLRKYQEELFQEAILRDTIIYLPTGGGKTVVAASVAKYMCQKHGGKVVFIVNRVPLVEQQAAVLRRVFGGQHTVEEVRGQKKSVPNWDEFMRRESKAVVIIDTIFHKWINDCSEIITKHTCLIIFDEVHHAIGGCLRNIFSFIHRMSARGMEKGSQLKLPLLLGLTASPVLSFTSTKSLMQLVEATRCHIVQVTKHVDSLRQSVSLPTTIAVEYHLSPPEEAFQLYIVEVVEALMKHSSVNGDKLLKGAFHGAVGSSAHINSCRMVQSHALKTVKGKANLFAYCVATFLFRVSTAIAKLSEGSLESAYLCVMGKDVLGSLNECLEAAKLILPILEGLMKLLKMSVRSASAKGPEVGNPSSRSNSFGMSSRTQFLLQLLTWIAERASHHNVEVSSIIFCDTRASAYRVIEAIEGTPLLKSVYAPLPLIGKGKTMVEGKETKMTDTQMRSCLGEFRSGNARLLVATSVAEEGLDIAQCNLIIRYDSCVSLRCFIQSRGRARRKDALYIVFEHARRKVKVASAASKAMSLQNHLVNVIHDALKDNTRETSEFWEGDPKFWLKRFEMCYGVNVEMKEVWHASDTAIIPYIVTLSVEIPEGDEGNFFSPQYRGRVVSVECAGGRVKARQRAERQLCKKLNEMKLLDGPDGASDTQTKAAWVLSNGIYICDEGTSPQLVLERSGDAVVRIQTYDPDVWGDNLPHKVLGDILRRRRLPVPEVCVQRRAGTDVVELCVHMRKNNTVVQRTFEESGVSPLETAAFKALLSMGVVFRKKVDLPRADAGIDEEDIR